VVEAKRHVLEGEDGVDPCLLPATLHNEHMQVPIRTLPDRTPAMNEHERFPVTNCLFSQPAGLRDEELKQVIARRVRLNERRLVAKHEAMVKKRQPVAHKSAAALSVPGRGLNSSVEHEAWHGDYFSTATERSSQNAT